jgi:hypothetical protein
MLICAVPLMNIILLTVLKESPVFKIVKQVFVAVRF